MEIFDGKKTAKEITRHLTKQLKAKPIKKELVDVVLGEDSASHLYARLKKEAAEKVGINLSLITRERASEKDLLALVRRLNKAESVGGIMFQLPFPDSLKTIERKILDKIAFAKDVDGLSSLSLGQLVTGRATIFPASVAALQIVLRQAGYSTNNLAGRLVVVLGRSNIVGKPAASWLTNQGATVTLGHRHTNNLAGLARQADILISATGQPGLVKQDMVKEGAVVLDFGCPQGDVDFAQVVDKTDFITPVPGGIGPVTVAALLGNFVKLNA